MRINKTAIFAICLAIFSAWYLQCGAEVVDKIVAIINDEIITQGDLDRILQPIYQQYRNVYSDEELSEKLDEARRQILQKMIQDKLLLTEAKRRAIEVDDRELKEQISGIRSQFKTEKEFEEALLSENILLSDLEKKYRERMMINKLVESEIRGRASVSPQEVMEYYEEHRAQFKEPEKIELSSILIKIGEDRTEEKALELAGQILRRLEMGGNFKYLAKRYSDGPYADKGGEMGWVKKGELMNRIDELVFGMDENQISGILKTNLGYHIFKVGSKREPIVRSFAESRAEIEKILYNKKTAERVNKWIEELKENAYIAFR